MATMAIGTRPNTFEKKLVSVVTITTGEKKAKIVLKDDGKTFKNGENSKTVLLEDLPKVPKIPLNDKVGKEYRIRMSSDDTEVEAITPVRGHFKAKLAWIGPRQKDADPLPFEKVWNEGKDNEERHLEFFAVYQIIAGMFKGVELPAYWLHYKFEDDGDGFVRFAGNFENKKATRLFQLRDWGMAHNLWEEPIRWDDETILPELLERALESDVEVELTIDKGYIQLVQPPDGYDYEEEKEDDEPDFMKDSIEEAQDKIHSAGKKVVAPAKTKSNGSKVKKISKKVAVAEDDEL